MLIVMHIPHFGHVIPALCLARLYLRPLDRTKSLHLCSLSGVCRCASLPRRIQPELMEETTSCQRKVVLACWPPSDLTHRPNVYMLLLQSYPDFPALKVARDCRK